MSNKQIYEAVTKKIVEQLEKGIIPWRKTWAGNAPRSYATQKEYRGINRMLLDRGGEYITFVECTKLGGKIKKGAKSEMIVFFKWIEIEEVDEQIGDAKRIPFMKFSRVFHIDDCENILSKHKITYNIKRNNPIEEAEAVAAAYIGAEKVTFQTSDGDRAYYRSCDDYVHLPSIEFFDTSEAYYETLFHELTHSTGHENRLNRQLTGRFGSKSYSKEELIAEMGAAMLSGSIGIVNDIENHAAYCRSWLKVLKKDKSMIISSASQAEKATDFILERSGQ